MTARDYPTIRGTNPHTLVTREEGDISNLYQFSWYEWVYFRKHTAAFVKIFRNVAATSPVPAGLRNHYFFMPSTTDNLMNNQNPKYSTPLKDYTNI